MSNPNIYADNPEVTTDYIIAVMLHRKSTKQNLQWRYSPDGPYACLSCQPWKDFNSCSSDKSCWNWENFQYRANPNLKPKKVVPMERDDYPPFFWLRGGQGVDFCVSSIQDEGIMIECRMRSNLLSWKELVGCGWTYSTDRKTYLPCTKEVDA